MAFVFRSKKDLEVLPTKTDEDDSKIETLKKTTNIDIKEKKDLLKISSVPFLSKTTRKFINKVKETPGPGSYNIEDNPENFIHKQYIKKSINKYKDSLFDYYSIINLMDIKNEKIISPGPGEYNPGEKELFGAKMKIKNKNQSFSLYTNFPKIKNMEKISPKKPSNIKQKLYDKNNKQKKCNINNGNDKNDLNLIKRTQRYTMKELFRNLLLNHKLRNIKNEDNISYIKDSDIINDSKNIMNKTQLNINTNLNKNKIIKNGQILRKIKENTPKNIIQIKTKLQENNYYLNEFIKSKIFSEFPGPGYYFLKSIKNNKKSIVDYSKKSHSMRILNKNDYSKNNVLIDKKENKGNNEKKSKSIIELQSDIRKIYFEKEKEVYNKNKRSLLIYKIIKKLRLKEKENKNSFIENINNSKEIQELEYPNFYKNSNLTSDDNNVLNNFNSMEERFKGPTGYLNEIYKNDNPGPGQYQLFYNYNNNNKKNENIFGKKYFKKVRPNGRNSNDKTNIKKRKLFIDEIKNENPPVGSYQSQFHNTIALKNLMIQKNKKTKNPIKNGSFEQIKSLTERRVKYMKIKEKQSNSVLGPCSYFKNSDRNEHIIYGQNSSFGSNSEKNIVIKNDIDIGPGNYNLDLNNNWIKKSFNVLFI